jgi:hypothetical protein
MTVELDEAAFTRSLERDPAVIRVLERKAQDAAREAQRIAAAAGGTGYSAGKIEANGTRVENRDPFGHLVEWGSINNEPVAPLRRGAEAVGFRVVDAGA